MVSVLLGASVSCTNPEMWGWKPSLFPSAPEEKASAGPEAGSQKDSSSQAEQVQIASIRPEEFQGKSVSEPLRADWVVVLKSQRVMRLLRSGEVIREYEISLGKNPNGPKMRQGDNRTPEGLYVISGRNPSSAYHLALKISYPDPIDVINARSMGSKPGGNVMIHGLPNGVKNKYRMEKDWTNGCIAVSNEEMEEIWNLVPDGTPIEILP